jgi:hypothetical protein
VTEKIFLFFSKWLQSIFGKRVERREKVIFQKIPKKSEKFRFLQKTGEILVRRLTLPT